MKRFISDTSETYYLQFVSYFEHTLFSINYNRILNFYIILKNNYFRHNILHNNYIVYLDFLFKKVMPFPKRPIVDFLPGWQVGSS